MVESKVKVFMPRLEPELWPAVRQAAFEAGISIKAWIAQAIREKLDGASSK